MIEITEITALTDQQASELADILIRIVKSGASIGWLDTPDPAEARAYWHAVISKPENVLLLVQENRRVIGTAYLELAQRENGRHRAEVNKVLVHPDQQDAARPVDRHPGRRSSSSSQASSRGVCSA